MTYTPETPRDQNLASAATDLAATYNQMLATTPIAELRLAQEATDGLRAASIEVIEDLALIPWDQLAAIPSVAPHIEWIKYRFRQYCDWRYPATQIEIQPESIPQVGEIWRNNNRGENYEILSKGLDCETDHIYLHYKSVDHPDAAVRSRSLGEFLGTNRHGQPRFVRVSPETESGTN